MKKRVILSVINDLATDYRVHRVCTTILKSGAEVLLVGRKLPDSLNFSERTYQTRRLRLWFIKGPAFYAEYNIRLFFFLLFQKVDILVSNDLDTLPANYLVSKIRRKTLVYDSHEFFTEVPELEGRHVVKNIWKRIEKSILPNLNNCYTVCSSIAREYNKMYGVEFQVIRNLSPYKNVIKKNLPEKSVPYKYILYQGALNVGRGLEKAIMAMKILDEYTLILAGDGDITGKLRKLVSDENLAGKVIFTGRVPFENLEAISSNAMIGLSIEEDICRSYHYALPNKLFSYIQLRLPVLVSDLPEMAAVVHQYGIGEILSSVDAESIASKIKEICENDEKRNFWNENLEKAAAELCWEKEEAKLIEVYKKAGLAFVQ